MVIDSSKRTELEVYDVQVTNEINEKEIIA